MNTTHLLLTLQLYFLEIVRFTRSVKFTKYMYVLYTMQVSNAYNYIVDTLILNDMVQATNLIAFLIIANCIKSMRMLSPLRIFCLRPMRKLSICNRKSIAF